MGKKNKKVEAKLSDQELEPSVIGYLEESKNSIIGLVIFFSVFILVAFNLPIISEYVNKYLGKSDNFSSSVVDDTDDNSDKKDDNVKTDTMYDLSDTLEFTYENLKFTKFSMTCSNGCSLSINVENQSDSNILNTSSKFYFELYDSNSTMLGRHIFDTKKFEKNKNELYKFKITNDEYDKASKIQIVTKSVDDYPNYELTDNKLTCVSNGDTIEYSYDSKKISSIKNTLELANDGTTNYDTALTLYSKIASNYNNIEGVSSNIIEVSNGFTMTTDIDTEKVNIDRLENNNYYDSETDVKVVKFEMEARGYNCK
ncbi:MAG: hypothetical protein E7158_06580 [Firmicutes bacterium]|nr:hypothetical protein [Bacillota bacterium]